jgi:hypothetical protein
MKNLILLITCLFSLAVKAETPTFTKAEWEILEQRGSVRGYALVDAKIMKVSNQEELDSKFNTIFRVELGLVRQEFKINDEKLALDGRNITLMAGSGNEYFHAGMLYTRERLGGKYNVSDKYDGVKDSDMFGMHLSAGPKNIHLAVRGLVGVGDEYVDKTFVSDYYTSRVSLGIHADLWILGFGAYYNMDRYFYARDDKTFAVKKAVGGSVVTGLHIEW